MAFKINIFDAEFKCRIPVRKEVKIMFIYRETKYPVSNVLWKLGNQGY